MFYILNREFDQIIKTLCNYEKNESHNFSHFFYKTCFLKLQLIQYNSKQFPNLMCFQSGHKRYSLRGKASAQFLL